MELKKRDIKNTIVYLLYYKGDINKMLCLANLYNYLIYEFLLMAK